MTPSTPKENLITAEQLYELPDDGQIRGRTVARILQLLSNFVDARRLGVV